MTVTISIERPTEAVDSDSPVHVKRSKRTATFWHDDNGNPTGGHSEGEGYSITWQDGVHEPNGAILEDVIASAVERLQFFQGELPEHKRGKFACRENALAITHLQEALHWLNHRTLERRKRGVEGSYKA